MVNVGLKCRVQSFEAPSAPIKCVRTSSHLDIYVYYECSVATIKLLGCTHALRGQG